MWLPKNERKLFLYYVEKTKKDGNPCELSDEELLRALELQNVEELHELKKKLKKHCLIEFSSFGKHETSLTVSGKQVPKISQFPVVRLTECGERLAGKYNNWFGLIELWCKKYMWLLMAISAIGAIIAAFAGVFVAFLKD